MIIADSVWLATALLHRESSHSPDFSVQEIIRKACEENLVDGFRPGLPVHVSKHCVANKPPNPGLYRILLETTRGRRRLFKTGDAFHPDRKTGKIRPERSNLPFEHQDLIDWYDNIYAKSSTPPIMKTPQFVPAPHRFPSEQNRAIGTLANLEETQSTSAFVGPGGTVVLPSYLLGELGIREGSCLSIFREKGRVVLLPITEEFIRGLRGSLKANYSLQDDREREHGIEKRR
jgi:bifunctional DNA-binding transcriptional regulator/antitoxin component of YhaV-PrlF toxin-antitoxin module